MSNDLQEIKKRIYDEERIEEILDALGCQHIRRKRSRYEAQLPPEFDSRNRRAVQIRNKESLPATVWNRADFPEGSDVFFLVSYIKNDCRSKEECLKDLSNSKRWICELLGYKEMLRGSNGAGHDPLKWLRNIKRKRRKRRKEIKHIEPNKVLDESILKQYIQGSWAPWVEEGISDETQIEFGIGFDLDLGRVTIPIRNSVGDLIGVKGRTVTGHDMKYLYLYQCNKGIELFGMDKTLPYIMEQNEVIVFEGAKSVMKAWSYGIRNCVSLEGDKITDEQIHLLKSFGMDVRIIFAMDKDKSIEEIERMARRIKLRDVYAIIDERDKLKEKDAPIDRGEKVFWKLYNENLLKVN